MTSSDWSAGQLLASCALTFLVLALLDAIWLGWLAKDLYRREMGDLMSQSPRLAAAAVFYLAYPLAIVFFGLAPQAPDSGGSLGVVFARCAAVGLAAYGTYDLTCISVIRGFSVRLGLIDWLWGAALSGVSGTAAWAVVRWWSQRG